MADRTGMPRRKPVPPPRSSQPLPENWATDLTTQFRRTLSTKRMNELSRPGSQRRASSRIPRTFVVQPSTQPSQDVTSIAPPQSPPPSYSSIKYAPTTPTPPADSKSERFRHMLLSLSNTPMKWENPGLLDEALGALPLQRLYNAAQEESDLFAAEAASLGRKPAWGYQDCVVRALMRWFKREFFQWINNPKCSTCNAQTIGTGMVAPLPDESARGANRVELYQCSNTRCMSFERFPRYNDAFVLMQTQRGRVGEWANCFSMLCRAVGSRVRWVWNSEDHVWTEVWSVHRNRWVHVDCCEEAWDTPLLYTQGWNRKLAYCIAFSADGCQDVTRRYVRSNDYAAPRNRCPEGVLLYIIAEIKAMRRRNMEKQERFRVNHEDMQENEAFRKLIIEALAFSVSRILPGGDGVSGTQTLRPDADTQKASESRQEAGNEAHRSQQHTSRDQRRQ